MAVTYYKAVLNGACRGQDIKNILYYRIGVGVDLSGFNFAGAEALAGNIKQEIWPVMQTLMPDDYMLESIDVYPINDDFQLAYQMPFSQAVAEVGLVASPHTGPASCIIFKMVLEPTTIVNGVFPPKRGYLAVGPVVNSLIGEDGFLTPASTAPGTSIANLAAAFAQNIEQLIPTPAVWYPIRLKQNRLLGGLVNWESFADVKGCQVSRRVTFRRSRMPEL